MYQALSLTHLFYLVGGGLLCALGYWLFFVRPGEARLTRELIDHQIGQAIDGVAEEIAQSKTLPFHLRRKLLRLTRFSAEVDMEAGFIICVGRDARPAQRWLDSIERWLIWAADKPDARRWVITCYLNFQRNGWEIPEPPETQKESLPEEAAV